MSTPAGWYPDPEDDHGGQRWWDGEQWTEHRAPGAEPAPPAATPPPPSPAQWQDPATSTSTPTGGGPTWDAPPPAWGDTGPPRGQGHGGPAQPYGVATVPRLNGKAVGSLVLSIVWLVGLGSIIAIVLGVVARREIRERGERGNGIAVAGIVIGVIGIVGAIITVALGVFLVSTGEELAEGADLTVVSQLQRVYVAEFGEYAPSVEELVRGLESTGNTDVDLEGFDDITIVRADEDGFCAESTLSGDVRHIGEGGFVSQPGSCPPG